MKSVTFRIVCPIVSFIDTTFTKILPGLAIDAISSKLGPTSSKTFQDLAKWGETYGCKKLDPQKLQWKHKEFWPWEYRNTELIAAARKTYFSAEKENMKEKNATDLNKKILDLVIHEHFNVNEKLSLQTFESVVKEAIQKIQKDSSVWSDIWNLYEKYPNTPVKHYTAWAVRWGIFFYLNSFCSFPLNALFTTSCMYAWTILLTPSARKDLANIRAPENNKIFLPKKTCDRISEKASELFGGNKKFEEELKKLKINHSIENPFTFSKSEEKNPKTSNNEELKIKNLIQKRNSLPYKTKEYYLKDIQMRKKVIAYYESKGEGYQDAIEKEKKELQKSNDAITNLEKEAAQGNTNKKEEQKSTIFDTSHSKFKEIKPNQNLKPKKKLQ